MATKKEEIYAIRDNHEAGWRGILKIYPIKELAKHWTNIVSLLFSLVIAPSTVFLADGAKAVTALADSVVGIIPSILGVVLAAYALIITFFSGTLFEKVTKPTSGKQFSVFQRSNASFALAVIILSGVLLSGFGVQRLTLVAEKYPVAEKVADVINLILSLTLCWGLVYGILLCALAALNMFGIGQTSSFFERIRQVSQEKDEETKAPGSQPQKPQE